MAVSALEVLWNKSFFHSLRGIKNQKQFAFIWNEYYYTLTVDFSGINSPTLCHEIF